MSKIVGIDADLLHTGVAVLCWEPMQCKTYVIKNDHRGSVRLVEVRDKILAETLTADLVVIEGYAYAATNQAHQLGELGGVLRVLFHENCIPWMEVAPSAVKKFATGKGNAPKDVIMQQVLKRWGVEVATSHEADAYILAEIGEAYWHERNNEGRSPGLTAFQIEVVDELMHGKPKKAKAKKKGVA